MSSKLTKPVFVKVSSLENSRDGYNVYVKVVSAEHSKNENGTLDFVRAVVADETGAANAFFKGDNAKLVKQGGVIAIRNGKIRLVKNHLSLEVDIFGRVTEEKVEITPNAEKNISEKEITRRPRNNRREGDNRRQGDNRRDNNERPRRDNEERPRRDNNERPRRDNEERPRRDFDEKPRRDNNDRPRRDNNEERPRQRRDNEQRPRRDFDEKPRRDNNDRPRRDNNEERPRRDFDNKPKIEWTKVGAIEPGDEGLNLQVKILSVQENKNKVRLVLADETAKVKAFFFNDECLKEGNTIVIFRAEATVFNEHIELTLPKGGNVQQSRNKKIVEVNEKLDISARAWVESA